MNWLLEFSSINILSWWRGRKKHIPIRNGIKRRSKWDYEGLQLNTSPNVQRGVLVISVANFGPSGSGSISARHGSGSGSLSFYHQAKIVRKTFIITRYGSGTFYNQAKIVRKTLIPTVLWLLYDFLSLKNYINVSSKSNKQKNYFKISFLLASWKVNDENRRIRIRIRIH